MTFSYQTTVSPLQHSQSDMHLVFYAGNWTYELEEIINILAFTIFDIPLSHARYSAGKKQASM